VPTFLSPGFLAGFSTYGNGSDMMVSEQMGARLPQGLYARDDEWEELNKEIGKEVDTKGNRNEAGTKVVRSPWRLISVSWDSSLPFLRDGVACSSSFL
jgi:hypothetical protein